MTAQAPPAVDLPVAVSVAGSDSAGCSGLQADLAAFAACGVHGCTVVTAVTAQTRSRVTAIHALPLDAVAAQIDAVASDPAPSAWKTGMLAGAPLVAVVAQRLEHHGVERLVVDPVVAATSGRALLDDAGLVALRGALLPLALVLTPNLPEARALLGLALDAPLDPADAARRLASMGPRLVVVKGGHAPGDTVVDVVLDAATDELLELRHPRVGGSATRGTGCTLSAAIAAFLARRAEPLDAVVSAREHLQSALVRSQAPAGSPRPLQHRDAGSAARVVARRTAAPAGDSAR